MSNTRIIDSVQVWWAPVGMCEAAGVALMDEAERRRYHGLGQAVPRAQFALSCALLRAAAAHRMDCSPAAVPLQRVCPDCDRAHGKPSLPSWTGLELTLSHTENWVVCAVSRTGRVGVDIEEDAPADVDFDALARRVLSPQESADYHSLAEGDARATAFLTYWVRKEAVLKATGDGLRLPMTSITVSPADEPPRLLSAPMLRKPSLTTLHNLRGPGNLAGRPAPQARVLAHVADSPSPKDISVIEADAEELLGLCPV